MGDAMKIPLNKRRSFSYKKDNSRHGTLAADSCRVCLVMPKEMLEDLDFVAKQDKVTISSIVRQYIGEGLINRKREMSNGK